MTLRTTPRAAQRGVRRSASAGLIVALLGITACGSSDDASSDASPEAITEPAPGGTSVAIQENGPVAVEGAPLDPFSGEASDPAVGAIAPVVTGESFDGTPIVIGGPTENPTMVVFLAHWCPHCNDEVPVLTGLNDAGALPAGLDVIGVSTAVRDDAPNYPPSKWVVDKGWPWPTMADDESVTAFNAMGGTSFPFTVVFDADGSVLARRAGEASAEETTAFLTAALGAV